MTASPRPECVAIRSVPTVRVNLCRSKIWPRHHRPHHVKLNRVTTDAAPRSRHHRPTRFRVATDGVTAGRITNDSFITDGVTTDRRTADRSTTDRLTASTSLATASLATASPRRRLGDGYLDGVATDRDIPDRSNTESGPLTESPRPRHRSSVITSTSTRHHRPRTNRIITLASPRPRHDDRVTPIKPPQTESAPIAGPPKTSLPTTKIRPTSPFLFLTPTASPPTVLVSPRPNQAAPPTASRSTASPPAAFHSIAFAPNAMRQAASLICATMMPPRPRQHERVTSSASPRPCHHRPRNVCRVICNRL